MQRHARKGMTRGAPDRAKALLQPYGDQANDPAVLELVRLRSQLGSAAAVVYRARKGT